MVVQIKEDSEVIAWLCRLRKKLDLQSMAVDCLCAFESLQGPRWTSRVDIICKQLCHMLNCFTLICFVFAFWLWICARFPRQGRLTAPGSGLHRGVTG